MRKGVSSVISITLVILITIVVAGVFFFWITTLQANSEGATYLAQRNLVRNVLSQAENLIDSYYTTPEEKDILAFSDFKVTICNDGKNILDLKSQKGVQLTESGTGNIVCAESVLDSSCLDSTNYILVGMSKAGSTASSQPAAIAYSTDDGTSWTNSAGFSTSSTDENVKQIIEYSVATGGKNPDNVWLAVSHDETGASEDRGRVAVTEDFQTWKYENLPIPGAPNSMPNVYSAVVDSSANTFFVGAHKSSVTEDGAEILKLVPTIDENNGVTDLSFTSVATKTAGGPPPTQDYDGFFSLHTSGGNIYLAGTGRTSNSAPDDFGFGKIFYSTTGFDSLSAASLPGPDTALSVNDFAETSSRVYAATSYDSSGAATGSVSDVYYDSTTLTGSWTSTGFDSAVSGKASVNALLDDPSSTGNEVYAGYKLSGGKSELRKYDGTSWGSVLKAWQSSTIYDLTADTTNKRLYAAVGNDAAGSEAAEIWQSGANYDDTTWTLVYSNTDRGAATSVEVIDKCNKHNPTCVGCNTELQPGECQDIQLVFEDSNCELSHYSPESEFELILTIGRQFSKVFNFKKVQNPGDQNSFFDGSYSPATTFKPSKFFFFLNASRGNNGTETDLTAHYNFTGLNRTLVFDWRVNTTAGPGAGSPASIAVLNMPFNNNTGTYTFLKDYSTFLNNGTRTGVTWRNTKTCNLTKRDGGCYEFGGSGQYITIPSSNSLDISENFSVEIWFNTSRITSACSQPAQMLAVRSSSGLGFLESWSLFLQQNGVIYMRIKNDTLSGAGHVRQVNYHVNSTVSSPSFNDSKWHQVVGVYNGTTIFLYYDGALGNTSNHTIHDGANTGNKPIYLGQEGSLSQRCFGGYLDNLKIYNTTLSSSQITKIYNSRVPTYNVTVSDLTKAGQNWTVAVTPGNGSVDNTTLVSNGVVITNCQAQTGNIGCSGICLIDPAYTDGFSCFSDQSCTVSCGGGGGGG